MASKSITINNYRTEIPGTMSADTTTWNFPQVNSKNANGKNTFWRIKVRALPASTQSPALLAENSDKFLPLNDCYNMVARDQGLPTTTKDNFGMLGWVKVESGIEGGKIRDTVPTIVTKGKNIGKKNATNPFTQALRDALSVYTKQVDKASRETLGVSKRYPPMLSEIYGDHVDGINFAAGVYVQRKYDGVRTVAMYDPEAHKDNLGRMVGSVIFYSRTRKTYPGFEYIRQELIHGLQELHTRGINLYIDGEMYKHGMKLQDISGYARREDKPTDVRIDYMVYDVFIPEQPTLKYSERKVILDKFFAEYGPFKHIHNVETFTANSDHDVKEYFKKFLSEGYEGAMIRPDLPYRYSDGGYHSRNLLKLKQTLDAEFKIVGYTMGEKGKTADAILFICETDTGIKFNVTPAMEIPERMELAKKMTTEVAPMVTYFDANYRGKKLVVYFDDWSHDKVPQRARTKGEVRTWE